MGLPASYVGEALVPTREIVAVADSTYASLEAPRPMSGLSNPITFITRLRLDGASTSQAHHAIVVK